MADIALAATATANVPTPAGSAKAFFVDTVTGKFAIKNSTGNYNFASPWGGEASIAASGAINTTATVITPTFSIPAGALEASTTYRVRVWGTCTSTVANVSTFRLKLGTNGTTADSDVCTLACTAAASGTNIPFFIEFTMTCRSTGAGSGVVAGVGTLNNNGVTGISAAAVVVGTPATLSTVNTTVANFLSMSYSSAAITTTSTFQISHIEIVKT